MIVFIKKIIVTFQLTILLIFGMEYGYMFYMQGQEIAQSRMNTVQQQAQNLSQSKYFKKEDRIKSFTQDIVINKDGTLTITEDIVIYNTNKGQIKRGIFRDLKTASRNKDVLDYYIDGGNWGIPIQKVVSIIHTPTEIKSFSSSNRSNLYSKLQDKSGFTLTTESKSKIPGNKNSPNLAVKVVFATGFVELHELSTLDQIKDSISPLTYIFIIYILGFIGYLIIYRNIKKRLAPTRDLNQTVVQYYPPKNISPAMAIFIQQGIDISKVHLLKTIFISLARRGLLEIYGDSKNLTGNFYVDQLISKTLGAHIKIKKLTNDKNIELPIAEAKVYESMSGTISLYGDNSIIFNKYYKAAQKALKEEFKDVYYKTIPNFKTLKIYLNN